MTNANPSPVPNPFDFTQAWTDYAARTQRLQAVCLDAAGRLADVRLEAGTEAYMEAFGHMVAVMSTPSPGLAVADWPARMASAQARALRMQQAQLEVWAHAMKATVDVLTQAGADQARAVAPVAGGVANGHFVERRASAEVINFADRRAPPATDEPAEGRGSENTGVGAKRQAGAQRR